MSSRPLNAIDAEVGERIRLRRMALGLSQTELGQYVGITYQQLQKCEKGVNRVGAGRLFSLAVRLGVPVSYFYERLPAGAIGSNTLVPPEAVVGTQRVSSERMEFILAYGRVRDPVKRRLIARLIEGLAKP